MKSRNKIKIQKYIKCIITMVDGIDLPSHRNMELGTRLMVSAQTPQQAPLGCEPTQRELESNK